LLTYENIYLDLKLIFFCVYTHCTEYICMLTQNNSTLNNFSCTNIKNLHKHVYGNFFRVICYITENIKSMKIKQTHFTLHKRACSSIFEGCSQGIWNFQEERTEFFSPNKEKVNFGHYLYGRSYLIFLALYFWHSLYMNIFRIDSVTRKIAVGTIH